MLQLLLLTLYMQQPVLRLQLLFRKQAKIPAMSRWMASLPKEKMVVRWRQLLSQNSRMS